MGIGILVLDGYCEMRWKGGGMDRILYIMFNLISGIVTCEELCNGAFPVDVLKGTTIQHCCYTHLLSAAVDAILREHLSVILLSRRVTS